MTLPKKQSTRPRASEQGGSKADPKRDALIGKVMDVAAACDPDPRHTAQVTRLALALFDKLSALHGLGARPRFLLEITAMLHDIGWFRTTGGGHHKHSRDMILETGLPGLTKKERTLCALVARYHTKAEPDASRHKRFARLTKGDRTLLQWLAAILRVADGLDCTHGAVVRIRDCVLDKEHLKITIADPGECGHEIGGGRKKAGLLERMAGRSVVFS